MIEEAYALSDTVTLCKRKLSLESLIWIFVGMAVYNDKLIADIVNQLDITELYGDRWEIELGYRERKQYMLGNRLTLRSRFPELVRQELWGILLTYNLIRYQMVEMCLPSKATISLISLVLTVH